TTPEDTPISGDLTDVGDSDPADGTALTANTTPVRNPNHGSIVVNANGTYTYTPNANYNGPDTVVVSICDAGIPLPAICINDTIFITVTPINDPPVVTDTSITITEDTSVVTICRTILDPDLNSSFTSVSLCSPVNGTLGTTSISGNQICVQYTPSLHDNGRDTICFRVCDNGVPTLCDTFRVAISITAKNDPPVVDPEFLTTPENVPISGDLTDAGDFDPDTTALVVNTVPLKGPSNGSIVINANGSFTYTPATNFNGRDTVVVEICDSGNPLPVICVHDTIYVRVNSVNTTPIVANEVISTTEDTPISSTAITAADTDPDGTAMTATTVPVRGPSHGVFTISSNGNFTYTPATNYNGRDTVVVELCDAGIPLPAICVNDTIFITVTPVNDPPVAVHEFFTIAKDITITGTIFNQDYDPDGDSILLSPALVKTPAHGSYTISPAGAFSYTPSFGYVGNDTLIFELCDDGSPVLCTRDTMIIVVSPGSSYIPEGFSPNGDGINDNFVILSNPGDRVAIWVYNRWGNLVFEDKEYLNDWNGSANKGIGSSNAGLPDGTYFCIVDINNGEFKEVRYITIHR
ncbi:MAG: Ig-like domain-containing protein, partial [Cytophagaceae bacterium]|nr:Ig-like domain-containing protein [Cytophagaceae bacterium]